MQTGTKNGWLGDSRAFATAGPPHASALLKTSPHQHLWTQAEMTDSEC